jgi:hypothetical protein
MQEIRAAFAPWRNQPESAPVRDRPIANVKPPEVKAARPDTFPKAILFLIVLIALGGGYWLMTRHEPVATPATPKTAASSHPNPPVPDVSGGAHAPTVEAPPDKPAGTVTVDDGHPVQLVLMSDIPSDASVDDGVDFQVAEDVLVGDSVVIRKGTAVGGAIVDGFKKKLGLFTGKLTFRLKTVVMTDGQRAALRATAGHSGGTSKRLVDNGSNKRAKDVAAAAGTLYVGYIDGARYVGESQR